MLCGGVPKDVDALNRRDSLVEMRLDELGGLLRLYRRQLDANDSFRSFNLGKARGLLDEIAKIEAMDVDAFRDEKSKKGKVNAKVE